MKRAFVLFAVAILYCNPSLAQEPEPDPNLLWVSDPSWVDGFHRFLVHPNGNILAGIGFTEFELDGNTGLIIREFPHPIAVSYDVSPDGKYISALADSNRRCVIDYESEEILVKFTTSSTFPKFMPDNKSLIFHEVVGEGDNYGMKLVRYNIETNNYQYSSNGINRTTAGNLDVSPDGRYVATGGRYRDASNNEYTRLVLWDALTLTPIRVLGEFEDFNEVRSIKFSPDSRLVGFGVYAYKLYVFDTENFALYKYDDSAAGFGFITNEFLAIGGGSFNPPLTFKLLKLLTDEIIYSKINFTGSSEHNPTNNSIVVFDGILYCLDFEKILSGASMEPEFTNPFKVEYLNNALSIRNFTFANNQISCSITDINGRVIHTMNLNTSSNDIRIPLKLISGTYFLHIKDGSKEYVSKFLVVE